MAWYYWLIAGIICMVWSFFQGGTLFLILGAAYIAIGVITKN